MIHKTITAFLFCLMAGIQIAQADQEATKSKKIYFFGIAKNYTDSTACLTDICPIDNVAIDKQTNGVVNLELYTEQYSNFLKQKGKDGYICATFFSDKYKEIEKQFLKQRKKLERSKGMKLDVIAGSDFKFQFVDSKLIYRNSVDQESQADENAE